MIVLLPCGVRAVTLSGVSEAALICFHFDQFIGLQNNNDAWERWALCSLSAKPFTRCFAICSHGIASPGAVGEWQRPNGRV